MRVVVTSIGTDLDAAASPVFGRCPVYIFVDTETMKFDAVENPALSAPGGAGIQAAQFVVERGAQVVLTGNVGPNAFNVLQAANVPVHLFGEGTVRQAVEAYKEGQLPAAGGASASAHAGMGGVRRAANPRTPPTPASVDSRGEEIAALTDMARELRRQLAEVMERLDRLERGD